MSRPESKQSSLMVSALVRALTFLSNGLSSGNLSFADKPFPLQVAYIRATEIKLEHTVTLKLKEIK